LKQGYVFLIGAGPGDPGLITVKGLECIKKAEVIIYDRLAGSRLLGYADSRAKLIYAGKSPEGHTLKQEEINRLLVEKAAEGKVVARLKGGDPFVFGRGGEEAQALKKAGIPFEIVPGVTSAIAVPAYAGIPVTHRGLNSTLGIITGNEDPTKEQSNIDWASIKGFGTLVFLMGVANLPGIVAKLKEHGRDPLTPAAVIQMGTRPEQKVVTGTLSNLEDLAREIKNPAVIVVGEVVSLREELNWFEKLPLFGRRILVTRTRKQAGKLSRMIEERGGEAYEFPTIEIAAPLDQKPLDDALKSLASYHYLFFTSTNGVEFFFRRLADLRLDVRQLKDVKIGAIGSQTAAALAARGVIADFVPEEYRAEGFAQTLAEEDLTGRRVLLPRADRAREYLAEYLAGKGALIDEVVCYRTVQGPGRKAELRQLLKEGRLSAVTFTSSSTVTNFTTYLEEGDLDFLREVIIACIGPVTAETARQAGLKVDVVAAEYTIEGLVKALGQFFSAGN